MPLIGLLLIGAVVGVVAGVAACGMLGLGLLASYAICLMAFVITIVLVLTCSSRHRAGPNAFKPPP